MKYTTATFASATLNTIPAITFILALVFRLESVNIKKVHSVAKVIGTLITFLGAMVMTFYKGHVLAFVSSHHLSNNNNNNHGEGEQHWVIGTVLLFASCIAWAAFFILQALTLKEYPAELSLTALMCLMGSVEGAIATLVMENNMSVWKIGFDSGLLSVAYSGVVCSGIAYYVQGVVSRERGPFFVSAFSPLCMIFTAFLGSIFLAETLHLGSILGAILIVFGLYTLVWGKSKEPLLTTTAIAEDTFLEETKINVKDGKTSGDHNGRRELPPTTGTYMLNC
ncbi:unnamed protein product [Linum tenue]|uniref:WAT1-related protein n=1 Tax=Linum tenue TaxID=586396 RepID=A0AAV0IG30_9ROSI|nr:unnamed protein product [Linum tenue]